MIPPRWHKIISDLWGNKIRSLLVIASIGVGLFAVGIIASLHDILSTDMHNGYAAVNPANVQISTTAFDQDLVDRIKHLDGVKDAQGIYTVNLRVKTGPGEWTAINIKSIPDFKKMTINEVFLENGIWPPGDRQIVLERNKFPDTHAQLGDQLEIELPSGKTKSLRLAGIVHDQTVGASGIGGGYFLAPIQGYITTNMAEQLEIPNTFNQLYVTVSGNSNDMVRLNMVAASVRREIEQTGRRINNSIVRKSIDHPNSTYVDAISNVLLLLGLFVVFLSGFLITNTLSALMNQQIQQIGIMKSVGARQYQIIEIYMLLILVFGILAAAISLPLSSQAAYQMAGFLAEKINFRLSGFRVVPTAVYLEILIAIIVPQVAGFIPILHGSRITVQEALSGFSHAKPASSKSSFDRWIEGFRKLSRPMIISLRNTFRRKGRLALTMITLSLGGAIFIATFNVQESLSLYIDQVSHYFLADVNLTLDAPQRIDEIQQELASIPGIKTVEGWGQARCELVLEDGSIGESVNLLAPPLTSQLIQPILISGRWLKPGDQNAIMLSERFLERFPNMKPGDSLRLRVNGKNTDWVVIGFFQLAGKSGGFLSYTSYEYLSTITHKPFKASTYRIVSDSNNLSLAEQNQLSQKIESHLKPTKYRISDISAGFSLRNSSSKGLNVLTIFLLIMAILTALVGSIGLMGTMSMNVLERTREIGIMRAIGASDKILMRLVLTEGMLIGLLSWLIGSLLAIPISKILSDTVSRAIFDAPSHFVFTPTGVLIWLAVVLALSFLSSVVPARNATRLTIREVLAYE